jgi:hypothetical protein
MDTINDCDYKPDFELADKYISFSAELLRLSLLAITGIGALIMYSLKEKPDVQLTLCDKYWLFATLLLFALASGGALAHRFWASDSLAYHIAYLRTKAPKEKAGRKFCLKLSGNLLIATEILFGIAIIAFVITILRLLIVT